MPVRLPLSASFYAFSLPAPYARKERRAFSRLRAIVITLRFDIDILLLFFAAYAGRRLLRFCLHFEARRDALSVARHAPLILLLQHAARAR